MGSCVLHWVTALTIFLHRYTGIGGGVSKRNGLHGEGETLVSFLRQEARPLGGESSICQ